MDKLKLNIQRFAATPPTAGNLIDEVCLHRYHQNIKRDYAKKGSNNNFSASQSITGDLTVSGDITNHVLDLFNDTSGSDWKDMLKNKIDYCISNINTTKTNIETFINGGWSGVNYGFGVFSKIGVVYQLVWFSSNATYYCRKLEDNTYQYTNITGVSTGSATVDNTYISNTENNHWEKNDKVVSYSFTMTVTGNWGATTQFLSGLPKAQTYTRFMGLNTSNQSIMRFAIDTNGNISNAYSNTTPSSNHTIEGHITYITSE